MELDSSAASTVAAVPSSKGDMAYLERGQEGKAGKNQAGQRSWWLGAFPGILAKCLCSVLFLIL